MSGKFRAETVVFGMAAIALAASVTVSLNRRHDKQPVDETSSRSTGTAPSIEELELQANANPSDGATWRKLGGAYFDAGQFDNAVHAYGRAAETSPNSALAWSSLGEARVMASKTDPMPAEALADFRKAIAIDPKDPRARYFLAVKKDLSGDHEGAIAEWLALLADTPRDAPWEQDLRRTIDQVGRINHIAVAGRITAVKQTQATVPPHGELVSVQGIPGPTAQDLRAAEAMPPSQQREMAQGMVARLEARLRANPADVDGWSMLMRSRVTLGEPEKASSALAAGIRANPGQAAQLRQEAAVLGVH